MKTEHRPTDQQHTGADDEVGLPMLGGDESEYTTAEDQNE
jgi:hypothetical protein